MTLASFLSVLALLPALVLSSPVDVRLKTRQSITTLTSDQVASYKPYTYFAAASYCSPEITLAWNCSTNCEANSDFQTTASGGDGGETQFFYVGYSPSLNTVIVAHQGTDTDNVEALAVNADLEWGKLDPNLFPGVDSSIRVHDGFSESHKRAAPWVLSAVNTTLASYPNASVSMVGHSLGGALALLDAVYLPLHLPKGTVFRTVIYGAPRVGNQAFVDYVDAHVTFTGGGLSRINNLNDPVPTVPGRRLGYHHPSGEVHIQSSGEWLACPGQDNEDDRCSTGAVDNIFEGNQEQHDGPYDGILIDCVA